ncbi:nucleotidyl transferase AbiEii/AbiGii toxin family protein [Tenggerimyces flavus]|uniref:Nucleotidyl transferase AbiEii/AbiGii toxin family protein n=1 Tax=Tenggerimyces flavus TaxID=1708749 RepID=A0ABV7Y4U9_9ACTN|nr:nucleotidyl transferase AbiEii/AbiGii toxin family protein [Tenggerimyces flavus]MBM7791235.1 putative nucleotidyltransferase component of viral defense system [Tenggerimyces flavus]
MNKPTRATTAGRVYLDLRARARHEGRSTDELLVLYVLERFLFRVSISRHRQRLVLKGGMLLAAIAERPPTRDIDLLAETVSNDTATISAIIGEIADLSVDDGVAFDPALLTAEAIRENEIYPAVRVTMPAHVDRARQTLRVDVSVGDPVTPAPTKIAYPALLGDTFEVLSYPAETVLAEKLVTMVDRGDANTRDRDFADVLLLIDQRPVDASQLAAAITATANHRGVTARSIASVLVTLADERQADWKRFLARSDLEQRLPGNSRTAVAHVAAFADPILTAMVTEGRWDHERARWMT